MARDCPKERWDNSALGEMEQRMTSRTFATRSKLVRRNRRHKRPFRDRKVMREVQQPGDRAGVVRAIRLR